MGTPTLLHADFALGSEDLLAQGWRLSGIGWSLRPVAPSPCRTDLVVAAADAEDHVAFPGLCRTRAGDLLIVYRHGQAHGGNEGTIRMVRSRDVGRTWGAPETIADAPGYDDRGAAIACTSDGTLVVCYFNGQLPGGTYRPEEYEDRYAWFITSRDEGQTWSPRVRIGDNPHFRARSRPLELAPGRWLFPVYDCSGPPETRGSYAMVYDVASGAFTSIHITRGNPVGDETAVDRAADGSLVAILRNSHASLPPFHYQCVSTDAGRTWSPARPIELPARFSPADLCRLPDGRLVCAWSFLNRRSERLALSRDNGRTWDVENSVSIRTGDPRGWDRAYPSCIAIDEESVGVCLYETAPHPRGGQILFARMPVAEFDRPGRTALCHDDPASPGVAFRPAEWRAGSASLRYRFTGKVADDGGEVALLMHVTGPGAFVSFSLSLAARKAGRESNQVALRLARPGAPAVTLAEAPARGGWFDDADEHTLTLTTHADGRVGTAIDGVAQLAATVEDLPAGGVGVRVEGASVAVYEVTVRETEAGGR